MKIKSFFGGLDLANLYSDKPLIIKQAPLPKSVVLPLRQYANASATPSVSPGDYVLTGQVIAHYDAPLSTVVHSSISGQVVKIDDRLIPSISPLKSKAITIISDGKDNWIKSKAYGKDFLSRDAKEMIDYIRMQGIVGLGGAGFPTYIKILRLKNCHTVIVNGTECEHGIMCDNAMMQNEPEKILIGTSILLAICKAERAIIAIENDKKLAIENLTNANKDPRIKIVTIPNKYVSGNEKILIKMLCNIEVAHGKYTVEYGILCQNVGTVKSIHDAIIDSRPLVSRVLTVSGSAVKKSVNYEVRLGMEIEELIGKSQLTSMQYEAKIGGMIMGVGIPNLKLPISKTTNAILINKAPPKKLQQPCIRCGACYQVCPIKLLPQQLYWYVQGEEIDKAVSYNLVDCIECNCCTYVCPSNIPLTNYFRLGKLIHQNNLREHAKSELAKERFEFRNYRLARNKEEHAKMMAEKKRALQKKMAEEDTQKDKIQAALERVNAKKLNSERVKFVKKILKKSE